MRKKKKKPTKTKKTIKKLLSSQPTNYAFWLFELAKPTSVKAFLLKGNERQHSCMLRTLNYLKNDDQEHFDKVNGKEILKKLKRIR